MIPTPTLLPPPPPLPPSLLYNSRDLIQYILGFLTNGECDAMSITHRVFYALRHSFVPAQVSITIKPHITSEWLVRKLNQYPRAESVSVMWYVPKEHPRWYDSRREECKTRVFYIVCRDKRIPRDYWRRLSMVGIVDVDYTWSTFVIMPRLQRLKMIDCDRGSPLFPTTFRTTTSVASIWRRFVDVSLQGIQIPFPGLESLQIEPARTNLTDLHFLPPSLTELDLAVVPLPDSTLKETLSQIGTLFPHLRSLYLMEGAESPFTNDLLVSVPNIRKIGIWSYQTTGSILLDASVFDSYRCVMQEVRRDAVARNTEEMKRVEGSLCCTQPSPKLSVSLDVYDVSYESLENLLHTTLEHHSPALQHWRCHIDGTVVYTSRHIRPLASETHLLVMSSLKHLKTVDFSPWSAQRYSLGDYFRLPPTLTCLRLKRVTITHRDMLTLLRDCPQLETLCLYQCTVEPKAWKEDLPERLHTLDLQQIDCGLPVDQCLFEIAMKNLRRQRLLHLTFMHCGTLHPPHSVDSSLRTLTVAGCIVRHSYTL